MIARSRSLLAAMFSTAVKWNSVRVSLVVGLCLNLINQGHTLWHGGSIDWVRLALNHVVPFLVASYSSARMIDEAIGQQVLAALPGRSCHDLIGRKLPIGEQW